MSNYYIPVDRYKAIIDSGQQLDRSTIHALLRTIDDYQNHPYTAGPAPQPPKLRPAKDQVQAHTEYLLGQGLFPNTNPILDVIGKMTRDLDQQAARANLEYDPASLQLSIDTETNGYRVRLTGTAKRRDQS